MLRTPRKQSAIRRADLSPVLLSERLQPRKEIRIIKRDLRYGLAAEFLYLRQQSSTVEAVAQRRRSTA